MIKIQIGDQERELSTADEDWINQQINRRRSEGMPVCVVVTIKAGDLDMILSTPASVTRGGVGRPPRPKEKEVFELWDHRGLNNADFTGGNVVAFLKQLKHFL
jgi:hypothetical protein